MADFGTRGVLDTMASLDAAGVTHCGAGRSDTEARQPGIAEANGMRIGFLSVIFYRWEVCIRTTVRFPSTFTPPSPVSRVSRPSA